MSCSSCGSVNNNCSCSDNCPNRASDITVFDCNTFNVIEIPCDASLCDVLGLLEAYTTNMVNELSNMTSVSVAELNCLGLEAGEYSVQQITDAINSIICGLQIDITSIQNQIDETNGMFARSVPVDTNSITPNIGTTWTDGTTQILTEVYDDDSAYNASTGIWTCPTTGRYDISFYVHMTRSTGSGWLNLESGSMLRAGIVHPSLNNIYVGSTFSATTIQRHADMSGGLNGVPLTAGNQLCLKVINESGYNYTSIEGDVCSLSIKKTK
jgi:hypothetical protein